MRFVVQIHTEYTLLYPNTHGFVMSLTRVQTELPEHTENHATPCTQYEVTFVEATL